MWWDFRDYCVGGRLRVEVLTSDGRLSHRPSQPSLLKHGRAKLALAVSHYHVASLPVGIDAVSDLDRKSTRLNSSHANISYAVFCLKKKKDGAGGPIRL